MLDIPSIQCKRINTKKLPVRQVSVEDLRIPLIRNIRKYPSLYKNEFLRTPFLYRHDKQQMWDKIAQDSGLERENAKSKWRTLIVYLRQHLEDVASKKPRRYIPNTDNPEDKYVQLTDWPFYSEMEFVVPYVKYAASKLCNNKGSRLKISSTEMDVIIEGLEAKVPEAKTQMSEKDLKRHQQTNLDIKEYDEQVKSDNIDDLMTEDDAILKEFFENMLKTTQRLPRFQQNRIKQQLLNCVNAQKALNKIN